jgi:hypothetical protein
MAEQRTIRQLVVIEDGTLVGMARNPAIVAQFPFLASLAVAPVHRAGCGRCGGRSSAQQAAFNAAKATIAGLDHDAKNRLRSLLNANKLRVRYVDGRRTVERTF